MVGRKKLYGGKMRGTILYQILVSVLVETRLVADLAEAARMVEEVKKRREQP